jgi:DNA modification methylase
MTDLLCLLPAPAGREPAAECIRETVETTAASVVSLQIPTLSGGGLDADEFLTCYHQHGVDLASIGAEFNLRDILLVKSPNDESRLNFVLLHVWNWPESTYDIDAVRVPYEGETDPRNNPIGKNPGNIWAFSEQLNDREPGSQARLVEPDPPETVADGHLELDAVERLITCHTDPGDTVSLWGSGADCDTVAALAADLGRETADIPDGAPDEPRPIPVLTDDVPIDDAVSDDQIPTFSDASAITDSTHEYYLRDARAGIQHLPDGAIQDVVTSPPYNIAYDPFNVPTPDPDTGKLRLPLREGYDDEMPAEQYHSLLAQTFAVLDEKMDEHSSDAFVNTKNNYNGGDCRPPFWLLELVPDAWQFTDLLVWRYDISYDPAQNKYKPYYEWVFRFSKGEPNRDTNHAFMQDYYIPIVKGNSSERDGLIHPAIYPKTLVKTCLSVSDHSGLVVDPFLGSGTTLAAAKECGRPAVGFEKAQQYRSDIETRLRRARSPNR